MNKLSFKKIDKEIGKLYSLTLGMPISWLCKKRCDKLLFWVLSLVLFIIPSLFGKNSLPFDKKTLIEGFGKIISGYQLGPYSCYQKKLVESWWEYPEDGTETVEWETPKVPERFKGKPVTFVIACGLGSSKGTEAYHRMYVNGKEFVRFNTPKGKSGIWPGKGGKLYFDIRFLDKNGDSFGIMCIHLLPEMVKYGKSNRIKVVGGKFFSESWFMLSDVKGNVEKVIASGSKFAQKKFLQRIQKGFLQRIQIPEEIRVAKAAPYKRGLSEAYIEKTEKREKICLNGIWGCQLVNSPKEISSDWGYFKVPGYWGGGKASEFTFFDSYFHPVEIWKGKKIQSYKNALYERSFYIKQEWLNKKISINFDGVREKGIVYINGKRAGLVKGWLRRGNELDISNLVKRGENRLNVYVYITRKNYPYPGINGDVWLSVKPKKRRIDDVFIMTSVKNKEIKAKIRIFSADYGEVSVVGLVKDKNNKTVKILPKKEISIKKGKSTIDISSTWSNPKLWSIEHPNLYYFVANLYTPNNELIDQTRTRFGFREFEIKGKDFYLNGKKIHFYLENESAVPRPWIVKDRCYIKTMFLTLKDLGFNGYRIHQGVYGSGVFRPAGVLGLYCKEADEVGCIIDVYMKNANEYLIEKYRNHPCILWWDTTKFKMSKSWGWQMSPYSVDGLYFPDKKTPEKVKNICLKVKEKFQEMDPTRPVLHYACLNVGDICNNMHYFNFIPIQEREDMFSRWSKMGVKPYTCVELQLVPWGASFNEDPGSCERLLFEKAAQYLGDKVYGMVYDYKLFTQSRKAWAEHTPFWKYNLWPYCYDKIENKGNVSWFYHNKAYVNLWCLFTKNILRSYRTYGVPGIWTWNSIVHIASSYIFHPYEFRKVKISNRYKNLSSPGLKLDYISCAMVYNPGILPFNEVPKYRPTKLYKVWKETMAPVLIYIGGRPGSFSSKDHAYFSKERVEKQIIGINNTEETKYVAVNWIFKNKRGKVYFQGKEELTIPPGEVVKKAFGFTIPEIDKREDYVIELVSEGRIKDRFNIQGFPREKLDISETLLLYDEKGLTAKMFESVGVKYRRIKELNEARGGKVLIIGRQSFSKKIATSVGELVREGVNVIVFEQDEDSILNPLLKRRSRRYTFIKGRRHVVLDGLRDEDFINWRGESDLLPPYPWPSRYTETAVLRHQQYPKWGNKGIVSSFTLKKPEYGNYRVILDCGFDLDRTPLVEFLDKKGSLILCQLDVTCRYGTDPVATKIVNNLLKYASGKKANKWKSAAYFGDKGIESELKRLKLIYRSLSDIGDIKDDILIIGGDVGARIASCREKINSFVKKGGKVVWLKLTKNDNLEWLPFKIKVKKEKFWRVAINKEWKPLLLEGLGNSDFFWKEVRELPVIADSSDMGIFPAVFSEVKYGKGMFIFLEVTPEDFRNSRAYAKSIRILSSVFTNLGLSMDFHLFNGKELDFTNERWDFKTDLKNVGIEKGWMKKNFDSSGWKKLRVAYKKGLTGGWELQGITKFNPEFPGNEGSSYNGFAWYRYKFFLPEDYKGKKLYLKIGAIDGSDWVYINGKEIGKTLEADSDNRKYLWDRARDYLIPEDVLCFGSENVIAIRVLDEVGEGGITKKPVRIEVSSEYPTPTILYPLAKPFSNYDPMRFRQW